MSDVLVSVENGVGRIALNRSKALHALNMDMCEAIVDALWRWRQDNQVSCVMIEHAEGRGFCAGGDIRMIAESGKGDGAEGRAFFFKEYQMNHLIFSYAKPIVAFMDGITMGGGVGLALPCQFRVATERTVFAMPETGIGLFPDVGGGWFLPRLPGRAGQWLALTGARINGADCCHLEIATHYFASDSLAELKTDILADPQELKAILYEKADTPPEAPILGIEADIARLFASDRLEAILADLAADPSDWAQAQLATLKIKSPMSCKVALRQLASGAKTKSFAENMKQEYAIAHRILQSHDFLEGVRAVIIDKDNAPRWSPATPQEVSEGLLSAMFAPLPAHEEWETL